MQYVYLVRAGEHHYKVGISANVRSRVNSLQATNPEKLNVISSKLVDNPYDVEQEIHKSLETMKASGANEWFKLTPEQAIEISIKIHKYPDLDVSEKATLGEIVRQQKKLLKIINRKLDYVVNTYQKDRRPEHIIIKEPEPPMLKEPEESKIPQSTIDMNRAMEIFKKEGKASTSLLQRRLAIGYGRASRTMDMLEERGLISALDGSIPRSVLID